MFLAVPVPSAFLVNNPCIYNNSVDYLTFPPEGLDHVQDRMVTKGHPPMVQCYSNR